MSRQTKHHTIHPELVARHIRDWMRRSNGGTAVDLAAKAGVDDSYIAKLNSGTEGHQVGFDIADRLFCAMGSPGLWYQDPELNAEYERVVPEADRLLPLVAA